MSKSNAKTMRKLWLCVLMAAVMAMTAVVLAGCGGGSSSSSGSGCASASASASGTEAAGDFDSLDPVTLVFASGAPTDNMGDQWGKAIAANADAITGGKLKVDYHGNAELGGDEETYRQMVSNDIQMVASQPASAVSYVPETAAFDLPMAFANYDAATIDKVINADNEFTQALNASSEKAGLVNLGFVQDATYRFVTSNKEVKTLADYKGLKIRTMQNANAMAFWEALGAEPTPMTFSEVYISLQNGLIEAQENPADTIVGGSLQEVQKYMAYTNHSLSTYELFCNKDAWDALDPAYQDALKEAIAQATQTVQAAQTADFEKCVGVMKDAGMEEITYEQDFFDEIMALDGVQKVYSDISKQSNGASDKMLELLQAAK